MIYFFNIYMCQQGLSDIVMLVLNIIINVDPGA